ncbi:MAG: hypothetical protein ABH828_05575 [archaeon]
MAWSFEYTIYSLDRLGIVDVVLPFIIVFTIAFAALEKSKILGKESKKFNVIIALVMGLAVVIPHVLWGTGDATNPYLSNGMFDVVQVMNNALPSVSLVAVAVIMVMLLLGIIGGDINFAGTSLGGIAVFAAMIVVLIIFLAAANVFKSAYNYWWLRWIFNESVKEVVVVILVFGIIIWFITKEDKTNETNAFKNFLHDTSKIFGGGGKK